MVCANASLELAKGSEVYVFTGRTDSKNPVFTVRDYEYGPLKVRAVNLWKFYRPECRENYFNPGIEPLFERYIKEIRPNIIHYHSLQAMGASILSIGARHGIPQVLTMHDWWWMCTDLFLVDREMRFCKESVDIEKCTCCGVNPKFYRERLTYLKKQLDYVEKIFTPSAFLRESLVRNGFDGNKITVLENGVTRKTPIYPKVKSVLVRFGYFGGDNLHKGIHVLWEAISGLKGGCEVRLYGIEETPGISMAAPERNFGYWIKRCWYLLLHQTPQYILKKLWKVTCRTLFEKKWPTVMEDIGKTPKVRTFPHFNHDDIGNIFSEIDILIIPSVMLESFNIVARESFLYSVPVICSDSGGLMDIVVDGINGLVFKRGYTEGLRASMQRVIENPMLIDRLKKGIDVSRIKSAEEQAARAMSVYREVLRSRSGVDAAQT